MCHASACRSYLAVQMDTRVETDWAVWGATECRVPFRPKVLPVGQSVPSGTILRGNTPHPGSTVLSGLACGPKLTSVVRSFVHVHVTGLLNRSNSPYVAAPVHRRLKTSGCGNSVPTTAPMPWCVYSETVVATTFTRCVRKFVKHCHEERSHRSLGNELILRSRPSPGSQAPSGRVACQERLGGVLKSYHRSAA
jgi:hypothetical protein